MIWLYRLLFVPALLVLLPYYLWRMRKRGGYGQNFGNRFGSTDPLPGKSAARKRIWLQAVSVGEMLAIGPLLGALQREGRTEVYLTTTTSTGYKLAKEKYGALTIGIGYFPLDFWPFSARAWRRVQPDLGVLMEGERWPEHVRQGFARGVPLLSVNARLSDRSYARSLRFVFVLRSLTRGITRVLCASRRDEQRFRELGFPREKVATTGNLKLDVTIPLLSAEEAARLRVELGVPPGLVLLGSSTWPGEEEALLKALAAARARGLQVSLLLVPRHAERREELRDLLGKSGFAFHFRSAGPAPRPVDVAVGDTTGELRKFTQLADVVFVGKSLAPHDGGQTPVEAAVLGKPVLHGPHMTNFPEIIHTLAAAGAVKEVATPADLARTAAELLQDTIRRGQMAAAARDWAEANRGATARTLDEINALLR